MQLSSETREFIRNHAADEVRKLALQADKYPGVDMQMAICQIAGRQTAAEKLPSWYGNEEILYPAHLPLEQCSSEITARYKASLVHGDRLVDLTGGFGIDCSFMGANFGHVTYVERNAGLCELALHNFSALGLDHICVVNQDSVDYLSEMREVDCIYIDPARRNRHGGKTFLISDCEPDVEKLEDVLLQKAHTVLIKLSPMLDLSLAMSKLSRVAEAYVVSVKNECKEVLLLLKRDNSVGAASRYVPVHCVNILSNESVQRFSFSFLTEKESVCGFADEPEEFLYEPNASILKAGAFRNIAQQFSLRKLHPNSHLYTSERFIEDFPGRKFRVCAYGSLKDKSITKDMVKANVSTRNFPLSAPELRKRLKLQEGGDTYIFGTTLNNDKRILIIAEKC